MNAPAAELASHPVRSAYVVSTLPCPAASSSAALWLNELREWFEADFTLTTLAADGALEIVGGAPRSLSGDAAQAVIRAASKRRVDLFHPHCDSSLLIIPLGDLGEPRHAAVADIATTEPHRLLRTAELFLAKARADRQADEARRESAQLSKHIGATFEEITLIHRLTQNLSISQKPSLLGLQSLEWLLEVVPAQGLALFFNSNFDEDLFQHEDVPGPTYLMHGKVPLGADQFLRLLEQLDGHKSSRPLVVNHGIKFDGPNEFGEVRELVVVPVIEGERQFGWLAAFNHVDGGEFGTVEANLLASVGTILGIHSGNIDLYKQQADLFEQTVRAMSSAIDANDPYTRGHSDRVARVSVRLAQQLGCDAETTRTLYLGGLLHDVGKIGIDDGVLRKPGKLTDAEYEHIKTHVEIGYRILRGLRKTGHILPIVLHHHESWDGKGYPYGLSGTNIPFLARIVAVADAYDAMSSDRPYRKGMEDAKLDAIFRAGSAQQWDPQVVDAFFAVRDDIRAISLREPDPVDAVSLDWTH